MNDGERLDDRGSDRSQAASHRPYAPPAGPFVMRQSWRHVLFAHWAVPVDSLRHAVPHELPIDRFDGLAWVGIVPFDARGTRLRWMPPIPTTVDFPELNVRTYVTIDGRPGVYFFSLDARSRMAVAGARLLLPYFHARMSVSVDSDGWVRFSSARTHRHAPPAAFQARYRPTGPVAYAPRGSLDSWLTDRYCLYTVRGGRVLRLEIDHRPWPLQSAEAELRVNTMTDPLGVALPDAAPLLHFARGVDARFWPPAPVRRV